MDTEQLKEDVSQGRIPVERLIEMLATLQRKLQEARQRIRELEEQLEAGAKNEPSEAYSVRAEEQRQAAGKKKRRRRKGSGRSGRLTTAEKVARAARTEAVYPAGVAKEDCKLSHTRPVWRLESGRAVLVAYEIYRGPKNQYGKIPGVLGRSEFGIEIVLAIAYQVYVIGLSFDQVCGLFAFFQDLKLSKSQAESLLKQLARHWEREFDVLCQLLAHSAIVHADETGWSIHSVWAFLSEKVRLLFFGVHKDKSTLEAILDPGTYSGIVISDDAAVYGGFTRSQKCWAHLLRKAIKLALLEPGSAAYRELADGLLGIYRRACRVQRDGRLGEAGRARKVGELEDAILELCSGASFAELPEGEGLAGDCRRLINEVMRLMLAGQLFCFVTAAPVETPGGEEVLVPGTNNEAERTLRSSARARKTGRTSKTARGARRRTVIVSVLESLRQYVEHFTLPSLIEEIQRWWVRGRSCFEELAARLGLAAPTHSVLDIVIPGPSG